MKKDTIKELSEYHVIFLGLGSWGLLLYFVIKAVFQNGVITLDFNQFGEMWFEVFMIATIVIFYLIMLYVTFKRDRRETING